LTPCAFAIDGQVAINQSTVMASGGFPYRITQPGSYKLTGNLVVPLNQVGILISTSYVALDLNGFNIQCSTNESNPNSNFSSGCIASTGAIHNIAIRNGSITASASSPSILQSLVIDGIALFSASQVTIEDVQIEVNTTLYNGHGVDV